MRLLITGCAGFIGYHIALARLQQGDAVIGIDNLNAYYDPALKKARLDRLKAYPDFIFYAADIVDPEAISIVFARHKPQRVVNLAAQVGVRYSLQNPLAYMQTNVVGFTNIIEACQKHQVEHLVYASTSSVYGANKKWPNQEEDGVDHPVSIYAASKKANELIAHYYSYVYQLPTTGLRFFTVYGPWGRPDMAMFSFTRNILRGDPIAVYNNGELQRDFTYIDDITTGISLVIDAVPLPNAQWAETSDPASSEAPYRIYNIGNGTPINLMDYIHALEEAIGKTAIKDYLPMQKGDVLMTHSDTSRLQDAFGYTPCTDYREGVKKFVAWYRDFYAE